MGEVRTIDPTTGEELASYPTATDEELETVLDRAADTARRWGQLPVEERAEGLRRLARAMRERREELAQLATAEMGKPIAESRAEVDKCAWGLEHAAELAPAALAPEPVDTGALESYVRFDPLGVVLAIMPWNFPYWQVIRAGASAMAAGNVLVLKHADNVTGCSLALGELVAAADLPPGLLAPIVVEVERVAGIIADPRVAAVTLTGSTRAGRAVASQAGAVLKKSVLELGGSDAFVVLEDADLAAAADWLVRSRFQNVGQSCIAAKRAVVVESVADELVGRVVEGVGRLVVGDPRDEKTTVGPMARRDLRDGLARQVEETKAAGAELLVGGRVLDRPGWFYEPTVLDRVPPGSPGRAEEVFGPALSVVRVPDAEAALAVANETEYGLGSNLWTSDLERARTLVGRIQAGHTAVNGMTASDPRLPFGGIKSSGYGRELALFGLRELVNVHSVVVNGPAGPPPPGGAATE
ncbi:NAD-dependent succinate-semialdehyde dehydrogenase [Aciditerrimonas ferrireducens]|jgi:acyl-CoA reductase-like NAD-dependent aldehyde dehydrogenase|uniref:NAD-dependent succinate-semialdehyde dehydrogenase n=1 Tax=Aciditerrimonas ferrireducens TaxID=667306 RepID=A0ABV6C647_9ACTN